MFQACTHIAKDEILLINCCAIAERSVAASGNIALCNNTANHVGLSFGLTVLAQVV